MAYTDDWESLMNGVFGPGGKLRSRPKSDPETPPKQSGGFAELNAVLLDQQRRLDEQLRRQSEQMRPQPMPWPAAARCYRIWRRTGCSRLGRRDLPPHRPAALRGLPTR